MCYSEVKEKGDGTLCKDSATKYMAALQQKEELSDTDGLPEGWEEGKKIKD